VSAPPLSLLRTTPSKLFLTLTMTIELAFTVQCARTHTLTLGHSVCQTLPTSTTTLAAQLPATPKRESKREGARGSAAVGVLTKFTKTK